MRIEYGAGSAVPEKTTIVLDSPHDTHISHARDGAGSEVSPHRLTSLLPSCGVHQTGASATYVSMYYISRTWSWAKASIWLPSPPTGLTIHIEAQVHGEPRGHVTKRDQRYVTGEYTLRAWRCSWPPSRRLCDWFATAMRADRWIWRSSRCAPAPRGVERAPLCLSHFSHAVRWAPNAPS